MNQIGDVYRIHQTVHIKNLKNTEFYVEGCNYIVFLCINKIRKNTTQLKNNKPNGGSDCSKCSQAKIVWFESKDESGHQQLYQRKTSLMSVLLALFHCLYKTINTNMCSPFVFFSGQ